MLWLGLVLVVLRLLLSLRLVRGVGPRLERGVLAKMIGLRPRVAVFESMRRCFWCRGVGSPSASKTLRLRTGTPCRASSLRRRKPATMARSSLSFRSAMKFIRKELYEMCPSLRPSPSSDWARIAAMRSRAARVVIPKSAARLSREEVEENGF